MGTDLHIGGELAIATGAPATNNQTGFEALTWVVINGMVEAPAFGSTHTDIQVPALGGRTEIRKGAEVGVASSLAFSEVASDTGQANVKTACETRGEYSLRFTDPDSGDVHYAAGILKDYQPNKPTNSSYQGASCNFVPNYTPVTV